MWQERIDTINSRHSGHTIGCCIATVEPTSSVLGTDAAVPANHIHLSDLDVEPAEGSRARVVAKTQEHRRGCGFDHCRALDRLDRCERIEFVNRHIAPSSEIDLTLPGGPGWSSGR